MIIFGARASNIGSVLVNGSSCTYCQNQGTQNITQFGKYFHIFWIPMFPIGRKTFAECTHCKRTIGKKEFTPKLKEVYTTEKSAIKRPIWHWSGLILIVLLILAVYLMPTSA